MLLEKYKNNRGVIFSLLIIGLLFWFLNLLTPEYNDDYVYKFMFIREDVNGVDIDRPIKSFSDVVFSQFNHYFLWNGRIVPHILAQSFSGIIGKTYFNVFNSCVFCLLIYFLVKLGNFKLTSSNLFFISTVCLFLFPSFNVTVLWMTGSLNYLWAGTGVCLFLVFLHRFKDRPFTSIVVILAISSIVLGCTQEGLTMPLAGSLIIYLIFNKKNISFSGVLLILCFITGACICSLSPATINRAALNNGPIMNILMSKLEALFIVVFKLRAFWLLIIGFLIILIKTQNKRVFLKLFYMENIIVCNAVVFSFMIIFVSGFYDLRAAIGVELFSLILILKLIHRYAELNIFYNKTIIFVLGIATYGLVIFYAVPNYMAYKDLLRQIKSTSQIFIINREPQIPSYLRSFIVPSIKVKQFNEEDFYNKVMASAFRKSRLAFIPESINEAIITNDSILKDISFQKAFPFYVVPGDSSIIPLHKIYYELRRAHSSEIPFYFKPVASKMERFSANEKEISLKRVQIVRYDEKIYLFIPKNEIIDYRVSGIKFE